MIKTKDDVGRIITAKLIKIDKNGSKHFEGVCVCGRCDGTGNLTWTDVDDGKCWECGGCGRVDQKWIERTPEYQAKLDAKRKEKMEEAGREYARIAAERKAKEEEEERIRKAAEEAEAARKAKSEWFGKVGDKIAEEVEYIGSPHYERKSFSGFGTETCYIHQFRKGNALLVWKTGTNPLWETKPGTKVTITGTVKELTEYKDEKQTVLTRCKIK